MKFLREIYIKTTNFTHGFQNQKPSKFIFFYKLWAPFYDVSIKLDPAYQRNLDNIIRMVVSEQDTTLDIGCGTGLGTIQISTIARKVIAIDPSTHMLKKLQEKINKNKINNIVIRKGFFPQAVETDEKFQSIISSFMLAHLNSEQRALTIKNMFDLLESGGKIGLFSAQGEIAPTFQIKEEIEKNLSSAGFHNIIIKDVDDIYRITTARKV